MHGLLRIMNKVRSSFAGFIISLIFISFVGCDKGNDDKSLNVFSIEDDISLGKQVSQEIESNPKDYPILSESQYPLAYSHLHRIVNNILSSGKVFYKDKFEWRTKIIRNDSVLNAFCAPGGYIYVYTGIIKFLESEDELAGVLGHEIAHADRRHSTDNLTKQYGVSTLLSIVLGNNPGLIAEVAANLLLLKFSRSNETESDKYSVIYLNSTSYDARGVSRFFEKLINSGQTGGTPQFLSTHPNPDNRVQNILQEWQNLGSRTGETFEAQYREFKNALP